MADQTPTFTSPFGSPAAQHGPWSPSIELAERPFSVTGPDRFHAQARRRRINDRAVIENPLAHLTDDDLIRDVQRFGQACLPNVEPEKILRAARVAKDIRTYDDLVRSDHPDAGHGLPVQLTDEEKRALKREKDVVFPERGMLIVVLTVSLAAFLQGQVQSSINGASLFPIQLGLSPPSSAGNDGGFNAVTASTKPPDPTLDVWRLGAMNASPFLFAATLGCPLALPINDLVGRRGAMVVAALLILASSLGSAFVSNWYSLFGVRIINGLGMGIKAVSTPILASETAVGFWRGTSILAWQLWVAFGIMMGFVFNIIFTTAPSDKLTLQLILGAPFVPAVVLLVALCFCPESPRYYMRRRSPKYNPATAYKLLLRLRSTELQALRDVYVVYKSIEQEEYLGSWGPEESTTMPLKGSINRLLEFLTQYKQLFTETRLRNALLSSSTVALAQQLCGINVLAFYSGTLFENGGAPIKRAMEISIGIGAVNFLCGLPSIRTIDTLGRRKWLIMTLPVMCLFMLCASLGSLISNTDTEIWVVAVFLFLFAAAYSPGLGPIPFTLASESFPLSHRESGCAFAIAVNLLFAGILSISFPYIISRLGNPGTLGLFAGLNLVAFVLVFLLVEETKRRSLEDLDLVFAVPKRAFIRYQVFEYLPWFWRRYARGRRDEEKPSLYIDMMWGSTSDPSHATTVVGRDAMFGPQGAEETGARKDGDGHIGDGESVDSLHA